MTGTDPDPAAGAGGGAGLGRVGIVGVVGRANVGKSSLVNAALGEKISIVSPVAQTTRNLIRGVLTDGRGQLVFLDTPGVHKAVGDLGRVMNQIARRAAEGVDAVLLVVDASAPPRDEDGGWMKRLTRAGVPVLVALNKADLGTPHAGALRAAWAAAAAASETPVAEPVWMEVSAATGTGLPELVDRLFSLVPQGPLLFPEDLLTDYPRKLNIADVIREKLFARLRDELPHAIGVWIDKLEEDPEGPWSVHAVIYVNKHSQKGIVIGERGRLLRGVQRAAEGELRAMYERPVRVKLWVKVEPNWSRNHWILRQMGHTA